MAEAIVPCTVEGDRVALKPNQVSRRPNVNCWSPGKLQERYWEDRAVGVDRVRILSALIRAP